MDLRAIAERATWDGADLNTPEAEALQPIINWKIRSFWSILTNRRITSTEVFRDAFRLMIAEAVMQGYHVGLAAGKHRERQRRRAKA